MLEVLHGNGDYVVSILLLASMGVSQVSPYWVNLIALGAVLVAFRSIHQSLKLDFISSGSGGGGGGDTQTDRRIESLCRWQWVDQEVYILNLHIFKEKRKKFFY